jgi:glycosyltransferase involved in cell wall biosynthesis
VIPAYNEATTLRQNVDSIEKVASQIAGSYEIIIAEDGCSDETAKIAAAISENSSTVLHLHSDHRLGKGLALKRALKRSEGQVVVFMDADLSTRLDHLKDVVGMVENGYDAVIASRYVRGSHARRPVLRDMASKVYNLLVRMLFRDSISDHQCGFKGFKQQALKDVLDETVEKGFLFDTELMLRMKRRKLKVIEIPVHWIEPKTRASRFKLFTDGVIMGLELFRLRIKFRDKRRV